MATAKKGGKSTKTAHVLNLLTAPGGDREAPSDMPQSAAPDAESDAQQSANAETASRPLAPPILEVARSNDAQLSEQIHDALVAELEGMEIPAPNPKPAPAPEPEPAPTPAPEPTPAPSGGKMSQEDIERMLSSMAAEAPPAAPAPEPKPAPTPAPEPTPAPSGGKMSQEDIERMLSSMAAGDTSAVSAPEPEPKPEPEPAPAPTPAPVPEPVPKPVPPKKPKKELTVLNIMEHLVELKAPRYIKMFGLCSCERCAADVRALTLSRLQPQYIVVPTDEVNAMITIYESRYNSTIFAQLTRACKVVMDNPRHEWK